MILSAMGRALDCLFIRNQRLMTVYTVALAVMAFADRFNSHTMPLFAWQVTIPLAAALTLMSSGILMAEAMWQSDHTFATFERRIAAGNNVTVVPGKKSKKAVHDAESAQAMVAGGGDTRDQWERNRVRTVVLLAWSLLMGVQLLIASADAIFLYTYTRGTAGYQAALDAGIPTATPASYGIGIKIDMLQATEQAGVYALLGLGVDWLVRRLYPKTKTFASIQTNSQA